MSGAHHGGCWVHIRSTLWCILDPHPHLHGGLYVYIRSMPWWPFGVHWVPTMVLIWSILGAHHGAHWLRVSSTLWWPLGVRWAPTGIPFIVHWVPIAVSPTGFPPSPYRCPQVLTVSVSPDDISCTGGQCLDSQRRPTPEEFDQFLPWFLYDRPTLQCAKGWVIPGGHHGGPRQWEDTCMGTHTWTLV